jgi:hydroxypyruvate isomerase
MPKFAANLTMMFNEVDFLDRFAAASTAGFKAVEFLFPYGFEAGELAARLRDSGLTPVLHNLPPGDWDAGERGIAILADRKDEFRASVDKAILYATKLNVPQLNCLTGIAPAGADTGQMKDTLIENLAWAADKFKAEGIKLLIEAINTRDIPGFYLNHTRQAADIIAETGSDNLFIQYDVYHMQIMEGDLAPTIEAWLDRIPHIQISDTPGRHEPGTGEINYPFLFNHIDRLGYQGWIGCEYWPAGRTEDGLGWLKPYTEPPRENGKTEG